MSKFYFASFNRASNGAIQPMKDLLEENGMLAKTPNEHIDYMIAVGDRSETFLRAVACFQLNIPIIHLWAGEYSCWQTHDDVYRTSMSLMSMMQLCVNKTAKDRNDVILRECGKKPNSYIVGNPYLDDMRTDDSLVPDDPYDLVLYNPVSNSENETIKDINSIGWTLTNGHVHNTRNHIWIEPNGDQYSDIVPWNTKNLPRPQYLGLLKNCQRFITNSSSSFTEAEFFHKDVIHIGKRNEYRDSRYEDMMIPGCKERVLEVLQSL